LNFSFPLGEKLDSNLTPILEKNIIKHKGGLFIRSGDTMIEYNPEFRLYITTCLRNPHYPPEVMVMVSLTYAESLQLLHLFIPFFLLLLV